MEPAIKHYLEFGNTNLEQHKMAWNFLLLGWFLIILCLLNKFHQGLICFALAISVVIVIVSVISIVKKDFFWLNLYQGIVSLTAMVLLFMISGTVVSWSVRSLFWVMAIYGTAFLTTCVSVLVVVIFQIKQDKYSAKEEKPNKLLFIIVSIIAFLFSPFLLKGQSPDAVLNFLSISTLIVGMIFGTGVNYLLKLVVYLHHKK